MSSELSPIGHFTLGVAADMGAVITTQPIDTINTNLMYGKGMPSWRHLWKGTLPACASAVINGGAPFLVNGYLTQLNIHPLASGTLTGILCSSAISPFERVTRLQQLKGGTVWSASKMAYQKGGLFIGLVPIAARDTIVWASYFGMRKVLDKPMQKIIPNDSLRTATLSFTMGMGAGILSYFPAKLSVKMNGDTDSIHTTTLKTTKIVMGQSTSKNVAQEIVGRSTYLGCYMLAMGLCEKYFSNNMPGVFKNK